MIPESGLELRLLRTFVVVAERRSFSRAADDLHIAQQAVSQHVKALERSLGVTLLRRTSRQVQLTAEGAVFLADTRRVLAAAGQPAYEYRFSYVAESMRKQWPGAPHATEIPFVFDTVAARYGKDLAADDRATA